MAKCDEDIRYFRQFLRLAEKGEIRLTAASPEAIQRETKLGNDCYLVVMDKLLPDKAPRPRRYYYARYFQGGTYLGGHYQLHRWPEKEKRTGRDRLLRKDSGHWQRARSHDSDVLNANRNGLWVGDVVFFDEGDPGYFVKG